MSRLHVLAQLSFRIVPSVASTTDDPSHLWLRHVRPPSESSLLTTRENDLRAANPQPFSSGPLRVPLECVDSVMAVVATKRTNRSEPTGKLFCNTLPFRAVNVGATAECTLPRTDHVNQCHKERTGTIGIWWLVSVSKIPIPRVKKGKKCVLHARQGSPISGHRIWVKVRQSDFIRCTYLWR